MKLWYEEKKKLMSIESNEIRVNFICVNSNVNQRRQKEE